MSQYWSPFRVPYPTASTAWSRSSTVFPEKQNQRVTLLWAWRIVANIITGERKKLTTSRFVVDAVTVENKRAMWCVDTHGHGAVFEERQLEGQLIARRDVRVALDTCSELGWVHVAKSVLFREKKIFIKLSHSFSKSSFVLKSTVNKEVLPQVGKWNKQAVILVVCFLNIVGFTLKIREECIEMNHTHVIYWGLWRAN